MYRPSVVKFSEFMCDALNNETSSNLLNAIRNVYEKYSNFVDPCPRSIKMQK